VPPPPDDAIEKPTSKLTEWAIAFALMLVLTLVLIAFIRYVRNPM
jgi:hypothetical protein